MGDVRKRSWIEKALAVKAQRSKTTCLIDWDAIRRDYATGRFTDSELAEKHNTSRETISRRRSREQAKDTNAWPRDLSEEVRRATNALLAKESVSQAITTGHAAVTETVISVAELNKQVILGHRRNAMEARSAMDSARARLLEIGDSVADIREAATFVSAVESLARTAKTVIDIERKAFGLDETAQPSEPIGRVERVIVDPAD